MCDKKTRKYSLLRNRQRFESEALVNGIPYGKSGYRGSARLYTIEVGTVALQDCTI